LLVRIRCGIHLRVRLIDPSVLVDHVRDAARVLVFRRVCRSVREADLALGVAQQREGEVELLRERGVRFLVIEADAEDLRVLCFVLRREVPEPGTFPRSTGGVGLRVEPEDDFLSAQIAETDAIAVVVGDVEVGSGIAWFEHVRFSSHQNLKDAAEAHSLMFSQ
jgi:hypothetical protein